MDLLGSDWSESDTTLSVVARALARLRVGSEAGDGVPALRTSVMTHIAWVPPSWLEVALTTLDGLADRHPSRTILLVSEPDAATSGIDAELALRRFDVAGLSRDVATEVVLLRLRGDRARQHRGAAARLRPAGVPALAR